MYKAGGSDAILSGNCFSRATAATFDGLAATNVIIVNDTTITYATLAHAAGNVDVVVTKPGGNGTLVNAFTYIL